VEVGDEKLRFTFVMERTLPFAFRGIEVLAMEREVEYNEMNGMDWILRITI